ncbi:MAG: hypothetical protein NT154_13525 [Verrucomicrobia bacterium]|nr:hypothetical protein [Verrucomicrobiota bacterium]
MDTGTTTLFCADALVNVPQLTVITNSVRIAQVMARGEHPARVFPSALHTPQEIVQQLRPIFPVV